MKSKIRFELDDYGKIGITLEEFDTIFEMDLFLKKFRDSNKVKENYLDKINEFLKTDTVKEFLKLVNGRENNGYLRGYTKYNKTKVHIPLIYESTLLPEDECFKNLKSNLGSKKVLYDIYHRKPFLLPGYPTLFLRDELCHAVVHNGTSKIFEKEFIKYIHSLNDEERYLTFRCLADKCHLLNKDRERSDNHFKIRNNGNEYSLVKTKHYSFGDYSDQEIHEMIKEDIKPNLREYADKEFNIKDIEKLLEEHDIDEIDRNTDYFDNKGKTR